MDKIFRQAVANQWSAARDIPWHQLPKLSVDLEQAVCQVMTFLTENEFAALYVPARFIPRIHPHYREVVEVLAVQVADEARHADAFTRRAEAAGVGLGTTARQDWSTRSAAQPWWPEKACVRVDEPAQRSLHGANAPPPECADST
ncbi:MAG TPA: hypothetical protein VI455_01800 [Terriglobia bacterium]